MNKKNIIENISNDRGNAAAVNNEMHNDSNGNSRERSHSKPHHAVDVHNNEVHHDQVHGEHGEHEKHGQHATEDQTNRSNKMKNETKNSNAQTILNNTLASVVFLFIIIIGSQSIIEAKPINIIERIAIDRIENDQINNRIDSIDQLDNRIGGIDQIDNRIDNRIDNINQIDNRIDGIERIGSRIASIGRKTIDNRIQTEIEIGINSNRLIIDSISRNIEIDQRISEINSIDGINKIINDRIQNRTIPSENIIERSIS